MDSRNGVERLSQLVAQVFSRAEGERQSFGETSLSKLLPQLVGQFIYRVLGSNRVGGWYRFRNIVVTVSYGNIFKDITSMNDVVTSGRNLHLKREKRKHGIFRNTICVNKINVSKIK